MNSRLHIGTFLGIAAILWFLLLLIRGTAVTWDHVWPFATVVGLLALLGTAFEKRWWRMPALHAWFVRRPDLRGTWRVELQSDWIDPETGDRGSPRTGYMAVEQTLSSLKMRLMTSESQSFLLADRVQPSEKGNCYLVAAIFRNEPLISIRGVRNEMHDGSILLETHGEKPNWPQVVEGKYWTDRATRGTLRLSHRVPQVFSRYEDAQRAMGSADPIDPPIPTNTAQPETNKSSPLPCHSNGGGGGRQDSDGCASA